MTQFLSEGFFLFVPHVLLSLCLAGLKEFFEAAEFLMWLFLIKFEFRGLLVYLQSIAYVSEITWLQSFAFER